MFCCWSPSCYCPTGIAVSECIQVEADAETLWQVVSDLDHLPDILRPCQELRRLPSSSSSHSHSHSHSKSPSPHSTSPSFQVGTKVVETRVYDNKPVTMKRTVVKIVLPSEPQEPREVQFSVDFSDNKEASIVDVANTNTLTIVPVNHETCELIGSFAIEANDNYWTRLLFCCCRQRFEKEGRQGYVEELQDYAQEAVRRKQKKAEQEAKDPRAQQ